MLDHGICSGVPDLDTRPEILRALTQLVGRVAIVGIISSSEMKHAIVCSLALLKVLVLLELM